MNNTLIVNGADYSASKVGKLNIVNANITKAGNGMKTVSSGAIVDLPASGNLVPTSEGAFSGEVLIPQTPCNLFGRITILINDENLSKLIAGTSIVSIYNSMFYHAINSDRWYSISMKFDNKPNILGIYKNIYNDTYSAVLIEGEIFKGITTNIDKLYFNWIRTDAAVASGVGIEVPEIYWGY